MDDRQEQIREQKRIIYDAIAMIRESYLKELEPWIQKLIRIQQLDQPTYFFNKDMLKIFKEEP